MKYRIFGISIISFLSIQAFSQNPADSTDSKVFPQIENQLGQEDDSIKKDDLKDQKKADLTKPKKTGKEDKKNTKEDKKDKKGKKDKSGLVKGGISDSITAPEILPNQNVTITAVDPLKEVQDTLEQKKREVSELKQKVDNQSATIKSLEESNEDLQNKILFLTRRFLYIPYDKYSVNNIAIPAFNGAKESIHYAKYQNALPLLENYETDINSLIEFLVKAERSASVRLDNVRDTKVAEDLNVFSSMPVVVRYLSYDDWKKTYIGNQILNIQKLLKAPDATTSGNLKTIRTKLEELIKNQ